MPLRLYVGYEMTDKKTEALKLALEALEESLGYVQEEAENAQRLYGQYPARQTRIQGLKDDARKHMDAITAIREALAEQPACEHEWLRGACLKCGQSIEQPAQQQEPVAEVKLKERGGNAGLATVIHEIYDPMREPLRVGDKLYTAPQPSKPWVGLTADEMEGLYQLATYIDETDYIHMLMMAEDKLKEKNT